MLFISGPLQQNLMTPYISHLEKIFVICEQYKAVSRLYFAIFGNLEKNHPFPEVLAFVQKMKRLSGVYVEITQFEFKKEEFYILKGRNFSKNCIQLLFDDVKVGETSLNIYLVYDYAQNCSCLAIEERNTDTKLLSNEIVDSLPYLSLPYFRFKKEFVSLIQKLLAFEFEEKLLKNLPLSKGKSYDNFLDMYHGLGFEMNRIRESVLDGLNGNFHVNEWESVLCQIHDFEEAYIVFNELSFTEEKILIRLSISGEFQVVSFLFSVKRTGEVSVDNEGEILKPLITWITGQLTLILKEIEVSPLNTRAIAKKVITARLNQV